MHLTKTQSARFFRLFNALVFFANERVGVVEEPFAPWEADADPLDTQDVLDAIWKDRSIIDEFAATNPAGLDRADIEQVLQWRHALDGYFVAMEHTPLFTTFLGDGYVFCVQGLDKDLARMIPDVPEPVRTALLPFDGRIVYSSVLNLMNGRFGGDFDAMLEEEYAATLQSAPLVQSVEDFVSVSFESRERAGRREIDEMLEELEDRSDPDRPGGVAAPHLRRGKLAGLTEAEREQAINEETDQLIEAGGAFYLSLLEEIAYPGEPMRRLADVVALRTKDDLALWARDLGIRGISKLKKADLADAVAAELLAQKDVAFALLGRCGIAPYRTLRRAVEAGGLVFVPKESLLDAEGGEELMMPLSPLLNAFDGDDGVTFVVPDEFLALLEGCDWNALEQERREIVHARHCVDVYTDLLGVVSVGDLWDLYCFHYPDEFDCATLLSYIVSEIEGGDVDWFVWPSGDDVYLAHYALSDEFFGDPENEDDAADCLEFRRYLLDRHEEIPIKRVEGDFDEYDSFEARLSIPSVKTLRDFFDGHVPEGQNEFFFADRLMEQIIDMTRVECPIEGYLDYLEDEGLTLGTGKANQMLTLLSNAINDMPHWANNGWSPTELLEQQTGKKLFRNSDGSIMKVGRNDPCPCGSGKKYKKCCGR